MSQARLRSFLKAHAAGLLASGLVLAGLFALSRTDYLLFHALAELFSIVIAATIFVLTWNARGLLNNNYLLLVGTSFLFTAGIDLLHLLAFRGMYILPGARLGDPNESNLATQLWVAARFLQSAAIAAAPLLFRRRVRGVPLLLVFGAFTGLLLLSIFVWKIFPDAFLDSSGLTAFKRASEYIIIAGLVFGMVGLARLREHFDEHIWQTINASLVLTILSEFSFTEYLSVFDGMNALGHLLKIGAFALVYSAIIENGFLKPQELLFRELAEREKALRESEAREQARSAQLEAIMDAVPAVVWIAHNADASQITGNRTSYELLHMPPEDNQSLSAPAGQAPEHFTVLDPTGQRLAAHQLPLQMAAASGQPVREFEETVVFTNGERRHLLGNVTPLLDEAGRPSGAVGAFIDITARVMAEDALQKSEQRYRSLFESMSEGFSLHEILLDDAGQAYDYRVLEVNRAYEKMNDLPREELIGRLASELYPEDYQEWLAHFARVALTGEPAGFETYLAKFDRRLERVAYKVGYLRVAVLSIDVTERYRSAEALQQSEARLRRLVDSNIIGIVYAGEQGKLMLANDAFLNVVGYTRADFEAGLVNWQAITPPQYASLDRERIEEAKRNGACTPYEKEYLRKDGSRVPILLGFAYYESGQAPFVAFIIDLTPQKQAEVAVRRYSAGLERFNRELARANAELQDFAFVASHDLQEPLRKIQAFGERVIVRQKEHLDEESREYLERMLSAATRMRAMIDDLLELSRVSTRGQPFQRVNLNAVAAEVLSDLEVRIERSGGRVELGSLPTIEADPLQMYQLLQNLVGNALKFHRPEMPPVVSVRGELLPGGASAVIEVEDNGIGFEDQYVERIFQPFQRLHGRSEYEGSGVGLAVCHKIVERHSGEIHAQGFPGRGSKFRVTLPAVQNQAGPGENGRGEP